jgi:hypothetical protein
MGSLTEYNKYIKQRALRKSLNPVFVPETLKDLGIKLRLEERMFQLVVLIMMNTVVFKLL